MDRSSLRVGRLSYQANAKGCTDPINCVKSRFGNVALLAALISSTKHDDQGFTSLDVVHSPTRTEMFPHFKDVFAHWFYITEVATLCLIETAA
jgi:hypothetical protein